MPTSTPSSSRSAPFPPTPDAAGARLEWRPSRLLGWTLASLTLAACLSLHLSELPAGWAWAATPLLLATGACIVRRETRRSHRTLVIDAAGGVHVDGVRVHAASLHWRGPLVRLDWREGRRRRCLLWWPDTLPPPRRRELRLASAALAAPPRADSMAP